MQGSEDRRGDGRRIVIFGGKGRAEMAAEYVAASRGPDRVLGFLNDQIARGLNIGEYEVLWTFADWRQLPDDVVFNAPLHKVKEIPARSMLVENLGIPETRWTSILHPYCSIARSAIIGRGASIAAFCDIQPGVKIGRHLAMATRSCASHDCTIGDFVFLGSGAFMGGYCEIGDGAFIGPNASIKDNTRIGRFAVVGIGACVVRDVADFEIVAGNPARRIGFLPEVTPSVSG